MALRWSRARALSQEGPGLTQGFTGSLCLLVGSSIWGGEGEEAAVRPQQEGLEVELSGSREGRDGWIEDVISRS